MIGSTEILLAWLGRVQSGAEGILAAALIALAVLLVVHLCALDERTPNHKATFKKLRPYWIIDLTAILVFGFLCTIPSLDDLWKVRINLIKFQLASPENLQKATETIERIGEKLECKYIGCDEKKEQAK